MKISENKFYWEHKGSPTILLGAADTDHLFQWTGEKLESHLDELVSTGGNYVRNTLSDRTEECVSPFQQVEDERYDLNQWNNKYWNRLEEFLEKTEKRDIIVQIELWDPHDIKGEGWSESSYNPKRNVNYENSEVGVDQDLDLGDPFWYTHPFYLAPPILNDYPKLLNYQKKFIKKVMNICLEYEHVLYTVCNECSMPQKFSNYWAQFIKEVADEQDRKIYVSDMRINGNVLPVLDNEVYDFSDISQVGAFAGQHHYEFILNNRRRLETDPSPMNVVKQYGSDAGEVPMAVSEDEAVQRFWRCIMAGCASVRFHRPEDFGIGLNSRAKATIKSARKVSKEFNLFQSEPKTNVLGNKKVDEAYVLAFEREYLVYFTDGGKVRFEVDKELEVNWLNIEEGEWSEEEELSDRPLLKAPNSGQWIAHVKEL
jgi:hypothetical protein